MSDLKRYQITTKTIRSMGESWDESEMAQSKYGGYVKYDDIIHRITELEQRNDELSATVERLRDYIERGSPYSTNPDKCERRRVLEATPQQNLNSVKREAAISAALTACRNVADARFDESDFMDFATQYANTKYPSGKEQG